MPPKKLKLSKEDAMTILSALQEASTDTAGLPLWGAASSTSKESSHPSTSAVGRISAAQRKKAGEPGKMKQEFICLLKPTDRLVPSAGDLAELTERGLGRKVIDIPTEADARDVDILLMDAYPALMDGGGYKLYKAQLKTLEPLIAGPASGQRLETWGLPCIYVVPLQKALVLKPLSTIREKCCHCLQMFEITKLEEHIFHEHNKPEQSRGKSLRSSSTLVTPIRPAWVPIDSDDEDSEMALAMSLSRQTASHSTPSAAASSSASVSGMSGLSRFSSGRSSMSSSIPSISDIRLIVAEAVREVVTEVLLPLIKSGPSPLTTPLTATSGGPSPLASPLTATSGGPAPRATPSADLATVEAKAKLRRFVNKTYKNSGSNCITISRGPGVLLEDAFAEASRLSFRKNLARPLKVQFVLDGQYEDGVDVGGVRDEFISLVLEAIADWLSCRALAVPEETVLLNDEAAGMYCAIAVVQCGLTPRFILPHLLSWENDARRAAFQRGLDQLGLAKFLLENADVRQLFEHQKLVTSSSILWLMECKYSENLDLKTRELATFCLFRKFVREIEDGNINICVPFVASNRRAANLRDLLQFMVGHRSIPADFEEGSITVYFADQRFPTSKTCSSEVWLPISAFVESYDAFREAFEEALAHLVVGHTKP